MQELLMSLAFGAIVNGLITFGVVKTTMRFLEKEIDTVRSVAEAAHKRIDTWLDKARA